MEPYDARYDDYYAMPPPVQHPHAQQPPHPYPHQMQRSRSAPRYPNERPPHAQDPNYYSHYGTNGRGVSQYRNHGAPPMEQYYDEHGMELAPPPPLPPHKKKKSVLKSPLTALKNALIKSTRPLRRMNSMVEPERKPKGLRRQQSMLERGVQRPYYTDEYPSYAAGFEQQQQPLPPPPPHSDPYYRAHYAQGQDSMMNSTYQNLESEDIYGNIGATVPRMQRPPDNGYGSYEQYDLYANRACIDLERRQAEAAAAAAANASGRNGRRIVRRHSTTTADRNGVGAGGRGRGQANGGYDHQQLQQQQQHPQDIYQTRQGAYMMPPGEQRRAPSSEVMTRRRFYPGAANEQGDDNAEPMYQSRREMQREMQRSHLYQSKREMQERIIQGKRDMERELSAQSSSQSERSDDRSERSERSDPNYHTRREATRTQLREQIYQTRREALDSMAEPIYVSKRDVGRPAPIYETREESILQSRENETDEKKECKTEQVQVEINAQAPEEAPDSTLSRSDLQRSSDTVIENTAAHTDRQAPLVQSEIEDEMSESVSNADAGAESSCAAEVTELPTVIENNLHNEGMLANETQAQNMSDDVFEATDVVTPLPQSTMEHPLSPRALRAPFHISNILKRTGPPPSSPIGDSCTSIETQYTSQASLPVGPPNATSTPFSSSMSLPIAGPVPTATAGPGPFPTLPREPSTTRGFFDSQGGTLADKLWHVSLQIPPGAIPPGVRQEIYFTVSDPRMGQAVGGPPLDMENGWSN